MTPLLALLVAYSVALIGLGTWIARRVRHTSDFFVGGRTLGAGLIFATCLASNIGGSATVGATALSYREGLAAWWWSGSAGIGSLVLAFWIGPRIWREATRHNLLTVGDFLEHHYGRTVRTLAAVVIWLGSFQILAGQFIAAGAVLATAGNLTRPAACLMAAAVMTAYFSGGGLLATASVNRVQLAVKLAGFAIATPMAVYSAHGLHVVLARNADHLQFWRGPTYAAGWPLVFLVAPAFVISPGLLQKAFGARDERALTRGVALNGVFLMLFAAAPVLLGMVARTIDPALAGSAQQALPLVFARALPAWAGGLALAAVFSAEMSAADAVLFMVSTSAARDLYRGLLRPQASDAHVLRFARLAAIAAGLLGFLLTFVFESVISALSAFYALLVVSLFAPTIGALLLPGAGRRAALASMVAGIATLLAVMALTGNRGFGWVSPTLVGVVTSSAVFLAVSAPRARRSRPDPPGAGPRAARTTPPR